MKHPTTKPRTGSLAGTQRMLEALQIVTCSLTPKRTAALLRQYSSRTECASFASNGHCVPQR